MIMIIIILCVTLLPNMIGTAPPEGTSGGGFGSSPDLELKDVAQTFFTAALFQSAFMGLVAGVFEEGEVVAGIKHTFIMLLITWLIFKIIAVGV